MPSFGGHIPDAADLAARRLRAVDGGQVQPTPRPAATTIRIGGPAGVAASRTQVPVADGAPVMPHIQSVIHPAGIAGARASSHLWWVISRSAPCVWIAVAGGRACTAHQPRTPRRRRRRPTRQSRDADASRSPAIVSVVALIALLIASVVTGRALDTLRTNGALAFRSPATSGGGTSSTTNPDPSLNVTTANEIHIPVGRPVIDQLLVERRHPQPVDPEPAGEDRSDPGPPERAVAAGRPARASTAGSAPSTAALQHAQDGARGRRRAARRFRALAGGQPRPAPAPVTPTAAARQGRLRTAAVRDVPHIAGTLAGGRTAPDLTHIASAQHDRGGHAAEHAGQPRRLDRRSAARSSPATRMPPTGLRDEELQAVARLPGDAEVTAQRPRPQAQLVENDATAGAPRRCDANAAAGRDVDDRAGLVGWLSTTDHKAIGRRFIVTAFVLLRARRHSRRADADPARAPGQHFLGPDLYNQIFTMHGTTMMFLFAVPVMLAMGDLPGAADDRRAQRSRSRG